jgi:IclR family acetate operon transcriptional repressor
MKERQEPSRTGGSATLNRALEVLEALAAGPETGLTAAQLAEITKSNRVSVHRILGSFVAHGFVRQQQPGARYRLGFRLLALAERVIAERDLVPLAQPLLEELAERSGETSHLAVLDGAEAVYVAKIESSQSIRLVSRIGARVPLYCTALGKSLLSVAQPGVRDRLLAQQSFERRTARTRTSPTELIPELDEIRERGYALDDIENEEGVRCVGAAVVDHAGRPVAAISVSGPTSRVTVERAHEIGRLTARIAGQLSAGIGHGEDGPLQRAAG